MTAVITTIFMTNLPLHTIQLQNVCFNISMKYFNKGASFMFEMFEMFQIGFFE